MKLNLASGQMYLDGYINIDNMSMYNGSMKVDKQADIFTLDWENNTVDEIILSHFAMYIELNQMNDLLKKWYGWLRPHGRIVIETGDVKAIAKYILETNDPDIINGSNGVMQLFGWESTKGHKWAWSEETLGLSLFQAGFRDIQTGRGYFHNNPIRDFLVIGIK